MNTIRRFFRLFLDSPTYGRERANLLSGFTIGVAGLLLNAAVLAMVSMILLDPREFREVTENVEFGQLLALILLGGASAFATLLIPLRLATVFIGPRVGRYFDQIVLSGISPFRFIIGKATSQNLYVGLILFLLLPYLVLSFALGGVDWQFFVAGVCLVWLYSLTLAMVTLWLSLYVNEIVAGGLVVGGAFFMGLLGCIPLKFQPFVLTPMPPFAQAIYASIPEMKQYVSDNPYPLFIACGAAMLVVNVVALLGIYLGPLYGIIRDNSTFGEVVRPGDRNRKRWFRFRPHIQRPSEIAFFYENRGDAFRKWEGLLRWGAGLLLVTSLLALADGMFLGMMLNIPGFTPVPLDVLHVMYLVFHGGACVLAIFVFSHPRNTTFLRIPFVFGWKAEVARLDTIFFLLFLVCTTAWSIATPFLLEQFYTPFSGHAMFQDVVADGVVNYRETAVVGSLILSCSALVIYTWHRLGCHFAWLKMFSMVLASVIYIFGVIVFPFLTGAILAETHELAAYPRLQEFGLELLRVSPAASLLILFKEAPSRIRELPLHIYFIAHAVLLVIGIALCVWRGRKLRRFYAPEDSKKEPPQPVIQHTVDAQELAVSEAES